MRFRSPVAKFAVAAMNHVLRRAGFYRHRVGPSNDVARTSNHSPPERALLWLVGNEVPTGGIRVHSGREDAYPEISGYTVPTLIQYGETQLARRLVRWLVRIQRPDGSFPSPEGIPYVFDTGQALRGLLAGRGLVREALSAAKRAADYLVEQMVDGGAGGFRRQYWYSMPESVGIYMLRPLLRAADVFAEPRFRAAAERCRDYYTVRQAARRTDILTHFLGYELEALIDLGETNSALPILSGVKERQDADGAVVGREGVDWVCMPGLAQLAVCWYKTGDWVAADRALEYLEAHQEPNGGFRGSYGPKASYFPDTEIPWAAKFYLDAHLLRVRSFFRRERTMVPRTIHATDGRARAILSSARPGQRILEVGCGKGRYLRLLAASHLDGIHLLGLDLEVSLLSHAPSLVGRTAGCIEALPYHDSSFDLVFAVEAIEHSPNLRAAIDEMVRVCRIGGDIVIIDKEQSHWGRLECPPWERWLRTEEVVNALGDRCEDVRFGAVGYDYVTNPDGLMVVWRGRKNGT